MPRKPTRRQLAEMQDDAMWVWDLAWIELQDELGRSPSQLEWDDRAREVARANR